MQLRHFFALIILIFFQCNSSKAVPLTNVESEIRLKRAIAVSKYDPTKGISELESLSNLPDYTEYKKNYVLGRLYEKKEETNKALNIYEKLLNKNYPLKERVLFHYAELNTKNGNDKKAFMLFNKLLRDFPYSPTAPQAKYYLAQTQLRLRLDNAAINTLESLRAEYSKTQFGIAANYYLGEHAYNKGNYNEAIKFWRQYLRNSPDGRFSEDIAHIVQAQTQIHLLLSDYSLLGNVFYHKKDYKNAAYYYKLGNNPRNFYELGYALFRIGDKNGAYKYLKEYAYKFPASGNVRLALLLASRCIPFSERQGLFSKVAKDIPSLAYYAIYKEASLEQSDYRKRHMLLNYIEHYKSSEFLLDAVWEVMWDYIQEKDYNNAASIGEKYFNLVKAPSEVKARIGFFLGKIAEIKNDKEKAIGFYKQTSNLFFDNYYSFRAKNRILALVGQKGQSDLMWKQTVNSNVFNSFNWSIPLVISINSIRKYFGDSVSELILLQQYDEAIDLIGKNESPSKKITAWLKAMNNEYEESINIASSLVSTYGLKTSSPLWQLAYPPYFWQDVLSLCKKYPNLDPFLVFGLIRQESRFDAKAKSVSSAYGLMQLIMPTARSVSRQAGVNLIGDGSLASPPVNIALGVHYLSSLISDLGNPLYAVASYNAGSSSVKKWIRSSLSKSKDIDFFVEEIPFEETRGYVKKVFSNYWTYIELYKVSV